MSRCEPVNHRREAERLLKGTDAYYNGGQTHRHYAPTEVEATRANAHALLALLEVLERTAQPAPVLVIPPHSRACGAQFHDHGADCHSDCPTCGGAPF